jgi:transposase
MDLRERERGDVQRLGTLIDSERNAKQRDRYRAALLAIQGEETEEIQRMLRRSRGFVQRWAYAYRDDGIDGLLPEKAKGRPVILAREQEPKFLARIDAGPVEADGVCAFTVHDAQHILEKEFGAKYSYEGARCLLHRLGYTPLRPRPRHEHRDAAAIEAFKADAPFLSRA